MSRPRFSPAAHLVGVVCACAALALGVPSRAAADEPPPTSQAARAAYDRGTAAYDRGEYAVAASEFATADALAPHPVALKWALAAVVKADDPVLGMTLVQRAERAPGDAQLSGAVRAARQKFERRVGSVTVSCPPSASCQARIDGASTQPGTRTFVVPGSHLVETTVAGRVERQWTQVAAAASVEVAAPAEQASAPDSTPQPSAASSPAPAPAAAPAPARGADAANEGGISPAWFWIGAGVTAVLGGVTIASGVDTLAKHDDYLATRDVGGDEPGRDAQLRTNVLIVGTAVAGAATALVGLFAVRWSPARRERARAGAWLRPSPAGMGARF